VKKLGFVPINMASQPESTNGASVRFTAETDAERAPPLPVTVKGVGEMCFERTYEQSVDEAPTAFKAYLLKDLTARQAIDEALDILATAPQFDYIDVEEVDRAGVTAMVSIKANRTTAQTVGVTGEAGTPPGPSPQL
jgi:hypothetical protein